MSVCALALQLTLLGQRLTFKQSYRRVAALRSETGTTVWDSSVVLAGVIEAGATSDAADTAAAGAAVAARWSVKGRACLELGAGCAVAGVCAVSVPRSSATPSGSIPPTHTLDTCLLACFVPSSPFTCVDAVCSCCSRSLPSAHAAAGTKQALAGASQVVFTDLPAILPVVESNVALATDAAPTCPTRVCSFEWCDGDAPAPLPGVPGTALSPAREECAGKATRPPHTFDVVLAADLVYKSVRCAAAPVSTHGSGVLPAPADGPRTAPRPVPLTPSGHCTCVCMCDCTHTCHV